MITYCRNKENSLLLEMKQEYQLSSTIQQNLSLLPSRRENQIILGNQTGDSIPKICAIFSLKNKSKLNSGKEREEKEEEEEKEKEKEEEEGEGEENDEEEQEVVQIGGGIFEEVAEGEDEDSIEEFDPEDPAFLEDEEEEGEEEEEEEEEESSRSPATVYKYDMAAKSYVRLERNEEGVSMKSGTSQTSEGEGENQREGMRPNILKRKFVMPTVTMKNGEKDEVQSIVEEHKIQKLDTSNISNVNSPLEEDGIMYVTVKGSKPNEILLVKVSKSNNFKKENC